MSMGVDTVISNPIIITKFLSGLKCIYMCVYIIGSCFINTLVYSGWFIEFFFITCKLDRNLQIQCYRRRIK